MKMNIIKQVLSFGFVGTIITILALLIYWGCVSLGIHYQVANTIGFVITVAVAYELNNRITFGNDVCLRRSLKGLLKAYTSYSVSGLFIAGVLLWLWTEKLGIDKNIAPLLNLFFTVPINFLLNKFWVYKK